MEIIGCPDGDCAAPAEIVDRWEFGSTAGPIEHVKTRCLRGHLFTVPVEPLDLDQALRKILAAPVPVAGPATGSPPVS
jgi:hypothetical protein